MNYFAVKVYKHQGQGYKAMKILYTTFVMQAEDKYRATSLVQQAYNEHDYAIQLEELT